MKVIDGNNVWDSIEELERRQIRAMEIARRMWKSGKDAALWRNRFVNLAQSCSGKNWMFVRSMSRLDVEEVILNMMRDGFPADQEYQSAVVFSNAAPSEKPA